MDSARSTSSPSPSIMTHVGQWQRPTLSPPGMHGRYKTKPSLSPLSAHETSRFCLVPQPATKTPKEPFGKKGQVLRFTAVLGASVTTAKKRTLPHVRPTTRTPPSFIAPRERGI